ncbi:phage tail assembly protein [Chengkuizengella axinellae]|uniref:Phage tail assembly protein n=1 Tax=Chengkuizengella axinellae TaxID=3064388 RepID=A0ABT9J6R2_9BACL|nr:phage tail assembly protein [Chengkuizengella sp. 2205SS18-9]MDP5277142.1 phage tail assembly protein [Chengkuizengella sp. 2205SS18-9]
MSEQKNKKNQEANVFELRQSIQFEEKEYKELKLDFDSLTGEDILACARQYNATESDRALVKETDKAYQAFVAAKSANVPIELIKKLNASDFSKVTLRAQRFLLGSD